MGTWLLLDLTRAFQGTELPTLIDDARRFAESKSLAGDWIVFTRRQDQSIAAATLGQGTTIRAVEVAAPMGLNFYAPPTVEAVTREVNAIAAKDQGAAVVVMSFVRDVLLLPQRLPALPVRVESISLGQVRQQVAGLAGWRWAHIAPLDEALEVLRQALSTRLSIHVTMIRPEMAFVDERFRGNAQSTGTAGMTTFLMEEGMRRGMWVVDGVGQQRLIRHAYARPPQPTAPVIPPAAQVEAEKEPDADQLGAMLRHLASLGLGPYSRMREIVFSHLEDTVKSGEKTVLDVIDEATRKGVEEFPKEYTDPQVKMPSIQAFRRFLMLLLERSQVLLDKRQEPLLHIHFGTFDTEVGGLADHWREECEALLFIPLAEAFEMDRRTLEDAARVLYFDDKEKGYRRLKELLTYLVQQRRIAVTDDGGITVTSTVSARTSTRAKRTSAKTRRRPSQAE